MPVPYPHKLGAAAARTQSDAEIWYLTVPPIFSTFVEGLSPNYTSPFSMMAIHVDGIVSASDPNIVSPVPREDAGTRATTMTALTTCDRPNQEKSRPASLYPPIETP